MRGAGCIKRVMNAQKLILSCTSKDAALGSGSSLSICSASVQTLPIVLLYVDVMGDGGRADQS